MFLLHFIGDVHQPLHTEKLDRGGNDIKVCFGGECGSLNLHSVWDTKLLIKYRGLAKSHSPAEEKQAAAAWAQELYTAQQSGDVASECTDIQTAQDCAVSWATEANAYVCSYVLSRGVDWLENNDLGAEYYDGAVPILDVLVGKAGRRLGQWLNNLAAARSTSMKVTQAEL